MYDIARRDILCPNPVVAQFQGTDPDFAVFRGPICMVRSGLSEQVEVLCGLGVDS